MGIYTITLTQHKVSHHSFLFLHIPRLSHFSCFIVWFCCTLCKFLLRNFVSLLQNPRNPFIGFIWAIWMLSNLALTHIYSYPIPPTWVETEGILELLGVMKMKANMNHFTLCRPSLLDFIFYVGLTICTSTAQQQAGLVSSIYSWKGGWVEWWQLFHCV